MNVWKIPWWKKEMIETKMILFEYKIFRDRPKKNLIITNVYKNLIEKYFLCKEDRHSKFIEIEKSICIGKITFFERMITYIEFARWNISSEIVLHYEEKEINRNRNPDINETSFNLVKIKR